MKDTILDKIQRVDNPYEAQAKERRYLIEAIEKSSRCNVAVLYQNLSSQHALLDDTDAEMLEAVLTANPPSKPLLLVINSNGGLPLAAERIVHVARTYAPKGFRTMIVQKAKSAATMVCLGSDSIYMTPTAEMGPIDPQIFGHDRSRRISVDSYLEAYDGLMAKLEALDMQRRNPAGLLHQLSRFDAAHVEEMRKVQELGRDMTRKFLKNYMLKKSGERKIENVVKKFSTSNEHKSHGRPIWAREAKLQGLKVNLVNNKSSLWPPSYELIMRYDHLCALHQYAGRELVKLMETSETSHSSTVPMSEGEAR